MKNSMNHMGWIRYVLISALAVINAGCVSSQLGGAISGLTADGLVLENGSQTVSPPAKATAFAFPAPLAQGTAFNVTVQKQPDGQLCSVANGSGTMGTTAFNDVVVTCIAAAPVTSISAASTAPIVTGSAVEGGVPIINLPNASPAYSGSYVSSYRAISNDIYAMAYNSAADELVVVGKVLAQGMPGIQGLDPATLAIRWSLPTPSAGDIVAVSDDGSKAFVSLCPQMSIAQVDLVKHSIDAVFPVGTPAQEVCAGDIAVRPGSPTAIAVTQLAVNALVPTYVGTVMFNNGVLLPYAVTSDNSSFFRTGSTVYQNAAKIKFSGANNLVGYSNYLSSAQIQHYAVSAAGLTLSDVQDAPFFADNFAIKDGQIYSSQGVVASAADLSGFKTFAQCQAGSYDVSIPDPDRAEILCATSVPEGWRLAPRDIEIEVSSWSLKGARVTRRTHLNLRDVIQIPGVATAEVRLLKMLSLPNGRIMLHIFDDQSNRLLVVGFASAELPTVSAPTIKYDRLVQSGTTIDRANVPVTATAYDPIAKRVYGIVPGSYGPNGSSLVAMDATFKQVIGFVLLDNAPTSISLSSDGHYAYVVGDGVVQQVDLFTLKPTWSWASNDCGISSVAPRPDYPQQLAVVGGYKIHLIDAGVETGTVARTAGNGCGAPGNAFFTDSTRIVEFLPGMSPSNVNVYHVASNALVADAQVNLGFSAGGSADRTYASLGYIYNDAGDIASQKTLKLSPIAPPMTSYSADPTANMTVAYPDGLNTSCGCAPLTAFAPLSGARFLATRVLNQVAIFDLMTGTQRTGRLIVTDPMAGQSLLHPTPIDAATVAFGQASRLSGKGSMYIVGLPF